ncbi:transcription factor bHLH153-like isoform X4 [Carya illinoinensis]|uniref:transcription factor bHLH153-like isoform X4 n=1 Tax=Carya illinoinensis TaxID=32201 RepID=UPI001C7289DD|nr:transcription factor bHLH153-like isoform X4 [Carya illinoinensis]
MQTLSGEQGFELGRMTEHKRSPCSVEQSSLTSLASKRQKADLSPKERKEKLGERIEALQQLVSPYGKVLSAPYLQSNRSIMQDLGPNSLRSRGLCLVPVSCTAGVAQSNGADIWTPIKTTSPRFEKAISQFL